MGKKVAKAVNDQEKVVIGNIQTLLDQLLNAENAEETDEQTAMEAEDQEQDAIEKGEDEDEVDEPEEKPAAMKAKKAKKALETTESDAGDGSADTEDRIDETQPETNIENIDEVAKAVLARLLGKSAPAPVKKSANSEMTKVLQTLTTVMKGIADRQTQTETALGNLLEGMGVAKQLEVAEQKVQKSKPVTNVDPLAVLKQLLMESGAVLKSEQSAESHELPAQVVHKNLTDRDVLTGLVFGTKKG